MKLMIVCLTLTATTHARAGNEDLWPVLHAVLGTQREKPCKEVWTHGDVTTYAMKLAAGTVVERANSTGSERKRYAYDARGRIVSIDGEDRLLGDFTVKVRYGKLGIEKLTQVRTPPVGGRRKTASTFELIWRRPKPDTVRLSVAIDGTEKATDVLHYRKGKLASMDLSVGDVMTAAYDDNGRLATITTTHAGKPAGLETYSYDASNRLVREDIDSDVDGVVDQKREYSYACDVK